MELTTEQLKEVVTGVIDAKMGEMKATIVDDLNKQIIPDAFKNVHISTNVKEDVRDNGVLMFTKYALAAARSEVNKTSLIKEAEIKALSSKSQKDTRLVDELKALSISDFASGGALIPDEFIAELIPYLEKKSVLFGAIPNKINIPGGTATIPNVATTATMYWVNETSEDVTTSEPTFGNVTLSAKKGGIIVPISNSLLRASTNIDMYVQNLMLGRMAAGIDNELINGRGSLNKPKGLYFGTASGNKFDTAGATAAFIRADLYKAIEKVEAADIQITNGAFIMNSRAKNAMRGLETTARLYAFRDEIMQGSLEGYKLLVTNNVSRTLADSAPFHDGTASTKGEIYFVDLDKLVLGIQKPIEIEVFANGSYNSGSTVVSGISRDQTIIRALTEFDFAMMYDTCCSVIEKITY